MTENIYSLTCGGLLLHYLFVYPETRRFFGDYLTDCKDSTSNYDICITPEYMEENRWLVDPEENSLPFLEFQSLMIATGNVLLLHRRALFHGVALLWKKYAWILTAPSGTGKTTQLRHWRRLLKKDVKVINGDKPLLECREDGSVWIYSSPWRGKERFGLQGLSAPLGGILLLKQGEENQIRRLKPSESVRPLFTEFVSFPENTNQLLCQAQILHQMLEVAPVWELTNLGDEASARMTQDTFESILEEKP